MPRSGIAGPGPKHAAAFVCTQHCGAPRVRSGRSPRVPVGRAACAVGVAWFWFMVGGGAARTSVKPSKAPIVSCQSIYTLFQYSSNFFSVT